MDHNDIVNQFRIVFNQLDTDMSGTLSLEEIKTGLKMIDFGLGSQNEYLAEQLFNDLNKDSKAITASEFIQWNLKRISNFIAKGQEDCLAEIFMSPAFQVIDKLSKFKEYLPADLHGELDFCTDKIRSGNLYSTGTPSDISKLSGVVKKDTLSVMMFFSEAFKKKVLNDDENSTLEIAQHRKADIEDSFFADSHDLVDLIKLESIDFDVFQAYDSVNSVARLLHAICDKCMKEWDLYRNLSVSYSTFMLYCYEISVGYREENPYHNNLHAGDVVQYVGYIIKNSDIVRILSLTPLHIMAILVAALVHDYKHPGVTNSFLDSTGHEISMRYNDRSSLENFHVSESFAVLKKAECNIFENLEPAEFRTARHIIIESVLCTDMAKHGACLNKLHTQMLAEKGLAEDKTLGLSLVLHAADLSHPSRPWRIHEAWTELVQEEFFAQGDKEKAQGMNPIPMFDRSQLASIPKMQIGFINGVILPYFKPLCKALMIGDEVLENIEKNRERWTEYN